MAKQQVLITEFVKNGYFLYEKAPFLSAQY